MGMTEELHKGFRRCAEGEKNNAADIAALQVSLADFQRQLISFTDRQTQFELVMAELLSWASTNGYEGRGLTAETPQE